MNVTKIEKLYTFDGKTRETMIHLVSVENKRVTVAITSAAGERVMIVNPTAIHVTDDIVLIEEVEEVIEILNGIKEDTAVMTTGLKDKIGKVE